MSKDTLFEIGSVTKVFTALLMAEMAERGELDVSKPLDQYLPPDFKIPSYEGQAISLEHLATQSSALPRLPANFSPADMMNPYADYSIEKLKQFLADYKLTRKPGTKYIYSNVGFGLLGHVLGEIGRKRYDELLRERILNPMGMNDTMMVVPAEKKMRLATPHGWGGQPVPYWQIPDLPGAGALYSSVPDLLTFLVYNMELRSHGFGTLGNAMKKIQQPYLDIEETGGGGQIARAWHLIKVNGQEFFFHDGGTGGFRSIVGFRRDKSWGIVVLVNSAHDCAEMAIELAALSQKTQAKVNQTD